MRICFFCVVLFLSILLAGHASAEEDFKLLGGGVVVSTSPYRDVHNDVQVVPIAVWDYKNFYIKGIEAGYHFYSKGDLQLSVFGAPRFMGYHSSDSEALQGMDNRKASADVGLGLKYAIPFDKEVSVNASVTTDAGSRSDGEQAELSVSRDFESKYFRLTPTVGVNFESSKMVAYYYGVRPSEAVTGRPEYEPGYAVNYFGNVVLDFGISKNWIVVTMAGVDFLGSAIMKSPIVDRDEIFTGFVGLARRF